MTNREFHDAIQSTVDEALNPVHFGRREKTLVWTILVLAATSAVASIITLILTW